MILFRLRIQFFSAKGIFTFVQLTSRMIVGYIVDPEHSERSEKSFSCVRERNCGMVGELFLDKHMTIEPTHFLYGEYSNAAK